MNTLSIKLNKRSTWSLTVSTHYKLDIQIDAAKSDNVGTVKEKLCQQLNFMHPHYFGFEYSYSKPKFVGWLNEKKSIKSEIEKSNLSLQLAFKFYDREPENITCEAIRHALYIQLRKDIVGGLLITYPSVLARLGGICLQIENGDYKDDNEFRRHMFSYTFAPGKMNLVVEPDSDFYNEVLDTYREYKGRDMLETEIEFLKICASLPFYGIHRFRLLDNNKNATNVGVGCDGICLLESDKIKNIILWFAVKSIYIKNSDVSIHIVDKETLISRIENEKLTPKYGLREDQYYEIYDLFPTNVAIYKSQNSNYSRNFYNLLVESFSFYQCKQSTKSKNSSDVMIDMTLDQIRNKYRPSSSTEGVASSHSNVIKRFKTAHLTSLSANQITPKRRQRGTFFNGDKSRQSSSVVADTGSNTVDDGSLHSSKLNEIQSRQQNAIKKRAMRSTLMPMSDIASRRRSSTINAPEGARLSLVGDSSPITKDRYSLACQTVSKSVENNFGGSQSFLPLLTTDSYNSTLPGQMSINSRKESTVSGVSHVDNGYSSDSSINDLHIESIENLKKPSDISSHLSALSPSENESELNLINGLKISDEKNFDNHETEILNNLINFKPSTHGFTDSAHLLDYINGESTLKEAKVLGDVITKIKNNGPSNPYNFPNNPDNNEATTQWIESIGNAAQVGINNGSTNSTNNGGDYFKGLEILDNDGKTEKQINPILEANNLHNQNNATDD